MNTEKKNYLVVTIPAFNEEATIADVIKSIPSTIPGVSKVDAVVIDDGSTDNTAQAARDAGAIRVVSFTSNRGLGRAFAQGLRTAVSLGADIIVNIDADGQFNSEDIAKVIEPIVLHQADMVTASRFADKNLIPTMPWIKKWGNKRVANLVNRMAGLNLCDASCGFRAYSRDAALRSTLLGKHTYTHEVILDLAFRGLKIVEVPIQVIGVRKFGKSKVAGNLWRYGWNSLVIMLRAFRDYQPMRVFGGIGLIFLTISLLLGSFLTVHFIRTGAFSPYIFIGFISGSFLFISLVCYLTALLAGMINRLRILQDEQLFLLRKKEYDSVEQDKP